ncbi:MAG: HDOD domain-containing protein [Ignavibacteriales bacterium]|nr:HDOD domain-containing protein [Ignavibacteriales bacterium]MCB9210477.1 HDOD domain-containing protein [Ignavibacteriales bacterium]MCB9219712.1 HDOD domain-containing protein [Ignavibacteriales bacterium]
MIAEKSNIYSKLDKIQNLPAIPEVMFDAIKTIKTEPGKVLKLAEIIGKDQGLVTKILSVANSPLYGLLRKVTNLEFAIMVMGSNDLENIITAISLSNSFNKKSAANFDDKIYWKHSMSVGLVAKDICRNLGFIDISGEAFVGGMLHDIGIQLFVKYFPDEYKLVFDNNNSEDPFLQKEIEILGMSHQDMGSYLLNKWELPTSLIQCIENHHFPLLPDKTNELVAVVHLADYVVNKYCTAKGVWDNDIKLDKSIISLLDFANDEHLDNFITDYSEVIADTVSAISF